VTHDTAAIKLLLTFFSIQRMAKNELRFECKVEGCGEDFVLKSALQRHKLESHLWCYKDWKWLPYIPGSVDANKHVDFCAKCQGWRPKPASWGNYIILDIVIILILYLI